MLPSTFCRKKFTNRFLRPFRREVNDFLLVNQFSITGTLYTCRPDMVGFVKTAICDAMIAGKPHPEIHRNFPIKKVPPKSKAVSG
jgi:hypothetical protein